MKSSLEFENRIKKFVLKNKLISDGDSVLICLSGGADSTCLLRVICLLANELSLIVHAAHVNHMLRGSEADADEMFCRRLCEHLGVTLHTLRIDAANVAAQTHQSVEAAARGIRYDYFFKLKNELGIDKIITAHNQNDNAETSLMYYLRGSGIDGVKGIAPKRSDNVVRPLLCVSRMEIEEYLTCINQTFVTDRTNFEDVYTRNKIRLRLLPTLKNEYNHNVVEALSDNALLLGMDAAYLNSAARGLYSEIAHRCENGIYIDVSGYKKADKALSLRVARFAIANVRDSDRDISYDTVMRCDSLFDDSSSKKVSISDTCFARRDYDRVYFEKKRDKCNDFCYETELDKAVYIAEADKSFKMSITDSMQTHKKNCEYFDYNLLCGQIYIRSRKNGDSFVPFKMRGKKKLKDFFIDEKISVHERMKTPLVTCGDEILWVCGMRRSDLYKVSDETKNILKIEFWEGK